MSVDLLPVSFILPSDSKDFKCFVKKTLKDQFWIVKPLNSQGGEGVQVVNGTKNISRKKPAIVQKYISDPCLINGHKFDLRLYVLITNLDPLVVYLYKDGLVRFASKHYSNRTDKLKDMLVHLTNWEINKVQPTK